MVTMSYIIMYADVHHCMLIVSRSVHPGDHGVQYGTSMHTDAYRLSPEVYILENHDVQSCTPMHANCLQK